MGRRHFSRGRQASGWAPASAATARAARAAPSGAAAGAAAAISSRPSGADGAAAPGSASTAAVPSASGRRLGRRRGDEYAAVDRRSLSDLARSSARVALAGPRVAGGLGGRRWVAIRAGDGQRSTGLGVGGFPRRDGRAESASSDAGDRPSAEAASGGAGSSGGGSSQGQPLGQSCVPPNRARPKYLPVC